MRDPRGPGAPAWRPGGSDPGKQSPSETNKLFGVKEGIALGVGETAGRQSPAPAGLQGSGSALARPRGPPGSAATGLVITQQGLVQWLPNIQVSTGVTPPGQAWVGGPSPPLP